MLLGCEVLYHEGLRPQQQMMQKSVRNPHFRNTVRDPLYVKLKKEKS